MSSEPATALPLLILAVVVGIGLFFALIALFRWLWNITMPDVFDVNNVTYWQAFRLLLMVLIVASIVSSAGVKPFVFELL